MDADTFSEPKGERLKVFVDGSDGFSERAIVAAFRREGHTVIGSLLGRFQSQAKAKDGDDAKSVLGSDSSHNLAVLPEDQNDPSARPASAKSSSESTERVNEKPGKLGRGIKITVNQNSSSKKSDMGSARPGSRSYGGVKGLTARGPNAGSGVFTESLAIIPNELVPKGSSVEETRGVISSCDVVIVSLLHEASRAVEIFKVLEEAQFSRPCHLICMSSFMTWAKSTFEGESGPEPVTENEFRRRQPHPGFKWQYEAEKVLSRNKNKLLRITVLTTGICYGYEQDIFQPFFKQAWANGIVTCFGNGNNKSPTIHIRDLATLVIEVVKRKPFESYIFACDETNDTLKEKLSALSSVTLSKVEDIDFEDAIVMDEWSYVDLDMLHLDIEILSMTVPDWDMKWRYRKGFTACISDIVQEFRVSHKVDPIKIFVRGPPGSGKSFLSSKLSKHYNIPHLQITQVISSVLASGSDAAIEIKRLIDEQLHKPVGGKGAPPSNRYSDDIITRIYKERLGWRDCVMNGFILDGYPKTNAQAQMLFTDTVILEEGPKPVEAHTENISRTPNCIITLEATLERLKEFLSTVKGWSAPSPSHNNEEGLSRRMATYQQYQQEKTNPLSYFSDKDAQTIALESFQDINQVERAIISSIGFKKVFTAPTLLIKAPKSAQSSPAITAKSPSIHPEQIQVLDGTSRPATNNPATAPEHNSIEKSPQMLEQHEQGDEQDSVEDDETLSTLGVPLRQYLLDRVMPVVAEALIFVARERPENPVRTMADLIMRARRRKERERKYMEKHGLQNTAQIDLNFDEIRGENPE